MVLQFSEKLCCEMLQPILLQWWRPQTERRAGLRSGERSRKQSGLESPPPFPYNSHGVLILCCVLCVLLCVVCSVLSVVCCVLTFDRVPCQPFKVSCFLSPGRSWGQGWCGCGDMLHIRAYVATQGTPLHLPASLSRPHFNER